MPDERQIFSEVAYDPCKIQCDNNLIKQVKIPVASNVVILSLCKNNIEKFDFQVLPAKIRELNLSCNKISRFQEHHHPITLGSLRALDLSQNLITDLHQMLALVTLPKLKCLDLASNRLQNPKVFPDIIDTYPSLQSISLATNGLQGQFIVKRNNSSIKEINMQGNRLTLMVLEGHFPKLKKIQMAVNVL